MRVYRTYTHEVLAPELIVLLSDEEGRHLASVRRVAVGDAVLITNGRGQAYRGAVETLGKGTTAVRVIEAHRETADPGPRRELAIGLTRSEAFDDMLHGAVELGMTHFQPLLTERTVVELDQKRAQKRVERWGRICSEALKQSERLWMPVIEPPRQVGEYLKHIAGQPGRTLLLAERVPGEPVARLRDAEAEHLRFMVGPEGGWSPKEREEILAAGATAFSFGEGFILRTETAALSVLAMALVHQ